MEAYTCPNCATALHVENPEYARAVVCRSCSAVIDLTQIDLSVADSEKNNRPIRPLRLPLSIGKSGVLHGETYRIVGRILYEWSGENYRWDEWLLLDQREGEHWLSDDPEQGLVLWHPFTPIDDVNVSMLSAGSNIKLVGQDVRVQERGIIRIGYLEGEFSWVARIGEQTQVADATDNGWYYSIEWTSYEVEYYRGERLATTETALAFGIPTLSSASGIGRSSTGRTSLWNAKMLLSAIAVLVLIYMCIGLFAGTNSQRCVTVAPTPCPDLAPCPSVAPEIRCSPSLRSGSPGRSFFSGGK